MSDLTKITKILAENQNETLKLIASVAKKQPVLTVPEETDSESENVPATATSTPVKTKTTTANPKITQVNSRNRTNYRIKNTSESNYLAVNQGNTTRLYF